MSPLNRGASIRSRSWRKVSAFRAGNPLAFGSIALALLVVVVLLASSSSILVFADAASQNAKQTAVPSSSPPGKAYRDEESGVSPNKWNWAGMADGSGFVDVIVLLKDRSGSEDPVSSVVRKISQEAHAKGDKLSPVLEKLLDEVNVGVKRKFTNALPGFSAHLTVESAHTLGRSVHMSTSILMFRFMPLHPSTSARSEQIKYGLAPILLGSQLQELALLLRS